VPLANPAMRHGASAGVVGSALADVGHGLSSQLLAGSMQANFEGKRNELNLAAAQEQSTIRIEAAQEQSRLRILKARQNQTITDADLSANHDMLEAWRESHELKDPNEMLKHWEQRKNQIFQGRLAEMDDDRIKEQFTNRFRVREQAYSMQLERRAITLKGQESLALQQQGIVDMGEVYAEHGEQMGDVAFASLIKSINENPSLHDHQKIQSLEAARLAREQGIEKYEQDTIKSVREKAWEPINRDDPNPEETLAYLRKKDDGTYVNPEVEFLPEKEVDSIVAHAERMVHPQNVKDWGMLYSESDKQIGDLLAIPSTTSQSVEQLRESINPHAEILYNHAGNLTGGRGSPRRQTKEQIQWNLLKERLEILSRSGGGSLEQHIERRKLFEKVTKLVPDVAEYANHIDKLRQRSQNTIDRAAEEADATDEFLMAYRDNRTGLTLPQGPAADKAYGILRDVDKVPISKIAAFLSANGSPFPTPMREDLNEWLATGDYRPVLEVMQEIVKVRGGEQGLHIARTYAASLNSPDFITLAFHNLMTTKDMAGTLNVMQHEEAESYLDLARQVVFGEIEKDSYTGKVITAENIDDITTSPKDQVFVEKRMLWRIMQMMGLENEKDPALVLKRAKEEARKDYLNQFFQIPDLNEQDRTRTEATVRVDKDLWASNRHSDPQHVISLYLVAADKELKKHRAKTLATWNPSAGPQGAWLESGDPVMWANALMFGTGGYDYSGPLVDRAFKPDMAIRYNDKIYTPISDGSGNIVDVFEFDPDTGEGMLMPQGIRDSDAKAVLQKSVMSKVITYELDGTAQVVIPPPKAQLPSESEDDFLARIAAGAVPAGVPHKIIEVQSLKTDALIYTGIKKQIMSVRSPAELSTLSKYMWHDKFKINGRAVSVGEWDRYQGRTTDGHYARIYNKAMAEVLELFKWRNVIFDDNNREHMAYVRLTADYLAKSKFGWFHGIGPSPMAKTDEQK